MWLWTPQWCTSCSGLIPMQALLVSLLNHLSVHMRKKWHSDANKPTAHELCTAFSNYLPSPMVNSTHACLGCLISIRNYLPSEWRLMTTENTWTLVYIWSQTYSTVVISKHTQKETWLCKAYYHNTYKKQYWNSDLKIHYWYFYYKTVKEHAKSLNRASQLLHT